MKLQNIQIGCLYRMAKCKHNFNNGKLVIVITIDGDTIKVKAAEQQAIGEPSLFIVGSKNLVKV